MQNYFKFLKLENMSYIKKMGHFSYDLTSYLYCENHVLFICTYFCLLHELNHLASFTQFYVF